MKLLSSGTAPVSLVRGITNAMLRVYEVHFPGEKPSGYRHVPWLP